MDIYNEIFHSFCFPDLALKKTLELNVAKLWAELDPDPNIEDRVLVCSSLLLQVSSFSFAALFLVICRVKDSEPEIHLQMEVWAMGEIALLSTPLPGLAASLLQHFL